MLPDPASAAVLRSTSPGVMHGERIRQMSHSNPLALHHYHHDVESVALPGTTVAIDPDLGRPGEFTPLAPANSVGGVDEPCIPSRLHFHEGDHAVPFHNQIQIPVPIPEPPTQYEPAIAAEPGRRHPLAEFPQRLPSVGHAT